MGVKRFDIVVGERSCSARLQTDLGFFLDWQSVLRDAHALHPRIHCQCRGNNDDERNEDERRLEVRCMNGLFFLARRRHTGPQHHDDCRFYAADRAQSGIGAYVEGLVDDEDGEIRIRVGMGLKVLDEPGATALMPRKQRNPFTPLPRVTLLGLLHLLWEKAGLNYCNPATIRSRFNIAHRLHEAAKAIHIGRSGLFNHLLVFDYGKTNTRKLSTAVAKQRRLFMVAPLVDWQSAEASEDGVLRLQEADGFPDMRCIDGLWQKTVHSFGITLAAWRHGHRVMVLAQIEPARNGRKYSSEVVGLSLMQVTGHWIAVESSYERVISAYC